MSGARIKVQALPDAPKPTKAVRVKDPREIERAKRIAEHREMHFEKKSIDKVKLCFWDGARTAKLRRLWEEGYSIDYISKECGCEFNVCKNRLAYEMRCGRIESRKKEVTAEETKSILSRYKAGESINYISKEMRMSRYTVRKILKNNEVEIRKQ